MPPISISFLPVFVAVVVHMVLGMLWYSQMLFGNVWKKHVDKSESGFAKMHKGMAAGMSGSFVAAIIMAYVLAHFVQYLDAHTAAKSVGLAFWLWIGFVTPYAINAVFFEKRSKIVFLVNVGYYLVSLIAMSMILGMWL